MGRRKGGEHRIDPFTGEREWWTEQEIAMEHNPRCTCGLMPPCGRCLPKSAVEFAQQHREPIEGIIRIQKR